MSAPSRPRDPLGYAVAAMNKLAQSELLDRLGIRKHTERAVFTVTRGGFRTATTAGRAFATAGRRGRAGTRPGAGAARGVFDLTPTEDEQLLVDVVTELATEVVRPAAADADTACATPPEVLAAGNEVGLPILGVPESLGGLSDERTAMTGTLVAEALAKGDLGIAVATLANGSVATALSLWGTDEQQATYLPAFTGDRPAAASLALTEPAVLFDALEPATAATPSADGYVIEGVKSLVPRGADAELFVVGAQLDTGANALFLVEAGADGLEVEADPAMGVRAASLTRLSLTDVHVPTHALLGSDDGTTYAECVRLSRLAWCALAVGTAQAVVPAGWRVVDIQCVSAHPGAPATFSIDVPNARVTVNHQEIGEDSCAFTISRITATRTPPSPGVAPSPPVNLPGAVVPRRPAVLGVTAGRGFATASVRITRRSVIKAQLLRAGRVVGTARIVRAAGTYAVVVRLTKQARAQLRRQGLTRVTLTLRVVVVPRTGAVFVFRHRAVVRL